MNAEYERAKNFIIEWIDVKNESSNSFSCDCNIMYDDSSYDMFEYAMRVVGWKAVGLFILGRETRM